MKSLIFACFLFCAQAVSANGTIILLVDTSSSISAENLDLQFDSYSKALTEMRYLDGVNIEAVLFNWNPLHIASGDRFIAAAAFDSLERTDPIHRGSTCLTKALYYIEAMINTLPKPVVLDISGDGSPNCQEDQHLHETLDRLSSNGVRVNTLLISEGSTLHSEVDPFVFYESMTRDGFMIEAESFYDFETALFEKLTIEISQLTNN